MHNREEKMAFLEEKEVRDIERIALNAVGKAEERYGKDVSLFSVEEIQAMFDTDFNANKTYRAKAYSIIRDYISWRKSKGYDVADSIDFVDLDNTKIIRKTMVSSPKHLNMVMDSVFEPVSKKSFDCLLRCCWWMAFFGMKSNEDVAYIKTKDVDLSKMVIVHNGKYYEMYKESLSAFKVACEEESLWFTRSDTGGNERKRIQSDYLMRSFRRETLSTGSFKRFIKRRYPEKGLTYDKIYWSGVFYRAFELERMGIKVDFRDEAISELEGSEITNLSERKAKARMIRTRIKKRYNDWKKAFS